ncbi:hypothetical protein OWR28_18795 [Chryseobacterium sp. 1B4]
MNRANGNPVYYKADGSLVQGLVGVGKYAVFNPSDPENVSKAAVLDNLKDRKILGNSLPKYFGAFNVKFRFYDFDFGTTIRFSGGNKIFNATRRDLMTLNFNNNSTEILGRWQSPSNPGDGNTPKLFFADNTLSNLTSNASSRFLEDASFIKFDIISLGYNFPKNILNSIGVKSARIYCQAQNAFIITRYRGLDPEMESSGVDLNGTPRQRVFSMGINVSL